MWLRLLGRGKIQAEAIEELVNLPDNYRFKSVILEVLYSLQKNLEINQNSAEREDRELMMRLAPLYQEDRAKARQEGLLEGEARGLLEGKLSLIIRQLERKLGDLNPDKRAQIQQLSLEKLETLAEALLDFNLNADLEQWLRDN